MDYLSSILKMAVQLADLERGAAELSNSPLRIARDVLPVELVRPGHANVHAAIDSFVCRTANELPLYYDKVSERARTEMLKVGSHYSKEFAALMKTAKGDSSKKAGVVGARRLKAILDGDALDGATFDEHLEHQRKMLVVRARQIAHNAAARGLDEVAIKDLMKTQVFARAERELKALVRTSTSNLANAAVWETGEKNPSLTNGYRLKVTLDSRTSLICIAWAKRNQVYPYSSSSPRPPFHFFCRTLIFPVIVGREDLDMPENADEWLKSLSDEEQNAILGIKRAQMFRGGRLDLAGLVRHDNTVATIAELKGVATVIELAQPSIITFTPQPMPTPRSRPRIEQRPRVQKQPAAIEQPASHQAGADVPEFRNTREAEKWLSNEFPHITFDFKGAHVETINPTAKEFTKLAREWPAVAAELRYVGTYRDKVKAPSRFERRWGAGVWAHASKDGRRLGLNPGVYGKPKKFQAALDFSERTGWHPAGANNIESVLTHEFGHHIDNWLRNTKESSFTRGVRQSGSSLTSDIISMFKIKNPRSKEISRYGATNDFEAWAESFAKIRHSPENTWSSYTKNQKKLLDAVRGRKLYTKDEWQWLDELDGDARRQALDEANDFTRAAGVFDL